MRAFYLKADCLNPPNIWRKCTVVSEHIMKGPDLKMYLVEVNPPFESDIYGKKTFSRVLLGMLSSDWDLDRIGNPHFVVYILHPKESPIDSEIEMSALKRLGMGNLSDAIEE